MRMAGTDRDLLSLAALAATPSLAAGSYGLYDLFDGSSNGLNSGEIPLNYLISMLPGLGTSAGAMVSALNSPESMAWLASKLGPEGLSTWVNLFPEQAKAANDRVAAQSAKMREQQPTLVPEEVSRRVSNRAKRGLVLPVAAGGALGMIPAIAMMQDRPERSEMG